MNAWWNQWQWGNAWRDQWWWGHDGQWHCANAWSESDQRDYGGIHMKVELKLNGKQADTTDSVHVHVTW